MNNELIKITFDVSDSGKVSLKSVCSNIAQKINLFDVRLKIELKSDAKIQLIDDLITISDFAKTLNMCHEINFILNENSYLEYRMNLKSDFDFIQSQTCAFGKNLKFNFVGDGASAKVRLKNMCLSGQNISLSTEQNHLCSNTHSCLCIKAVLMDNSKLKCHNKIFIDQKLDNVFARQVNRNLMLDASAEVFTQPQLEVLSDNVKCKHGATVRSLDEEQLFYLSLRGLSLVESKKLLTEGFLS